MWMFSAESLRRRLELDEMLRWWLDYWLFLHGDDTHPVWCARPLGLRALASAALASDAPTDWTPWERLKYETAIAGVPPRTSFLIPGSGQIGQWRETGWPRYYSPPARCPVGDTTR